VAIPDGSMGNGARFRLQGRRLRRRGQPLSSRQTRLLQLHDWYCGGRRSDFDVVGGEVSPLDAGRPIAVGSMKGRSRAYALTARNQPGKSALSVAFNDRCDMIVATAVVPHDQAATIEPGVMELLNSRSVLHWAEIALAL